MNFEDANYLVHQQRLLFEDMVAGNEGVDKRCLVQTYSSSLKMLNNEDALNLLNANLLKSSTGMNDSEDCVSFDNNSKGQWESNLQSLNVESIFTPLPCAKNNSICCGKTDLNQVQVDEVMKYFQTPAFKSTITTEPKSRKIAKSFAPRTCYNNTKFMCTPAPPLTNINKNSLTTDTPEVKTFNASNAFKTANEEMHLQNLKKYGGSSASQSTDQCQQAVSQRKQLGTRRTVRNKFVSPLLSNNGSSEELPKSNEWPADEVDERLKNIEPRMVELIRSEIMDNGTPVDWADIAGLEFAKTAIQEAVVWPLLRPDIFTGLRRPPKGILLFGPPGTGKTLIGKCIASQSKSTFFSISASSLTSKWVGDGEKMVRALFEVARCHQPAVIFIDEIDSLLSQRSDAEHESSRRIKTEFLVRLDGATTDSDEQILVVGATNRPQELDEAARRRFVKRLYIPLPDFKARLHIIRKLIEQEQHVLTTENMEDVSKLCDGYSGADMRNVCSEASMGPIRSIDMTMIKDILPTEVRPVNMEDFLNALTRVKSSVSPNDLDQYLVWNKTYGSGF